MENLILCIVGLAIALLGLGYTWQLHDAEATALKKLSDSLKDYPKDYTKVQPEEKVVDRREVWAVKRSELQ